MTPVFDPADTIVLVSLPVELEEAGSFKIVYTGVGKVNAAIAATRAIITHSPKKVVNFGTAGALNPQCSGLQRVTLLRQHDMDAGGLGFPPGQTPFDEDGGDIHLEGEGVCCGSGDQFITVPPKLPSDLVDMEAYALAKSCLALGVRFYCWKFVSDNADGNAAGDWRENAARGGTLFAQTVLAQRLL